MKNIDRRDFLKYLGIASTIPGLGSFLLPGNAKAKSKARVIVVGGGFGGATCANYLRQYDPSLDVILIEPSKNFVTCPFSNTVLAGMKTMDFITHDYKTLSDTRGVQVIHDLVTNIDATGKKVKLKGGKTLSYDRLVVSPGISFKWDEIEGANEATSELMPHAWKAGPQTALLRKQLESMKPGGTVVIATPRAPFRAPPAPYERASLIAYYLKKEKPGSKILLVDSGDASGELDLFKEGWNEMYKGIVERVAGSDKGEIVSINAKALSLKGRTAGNIKGDVVNLIPPQQAGVIAKSAGLTDESGWCPVDPRTFASKKQKDIHVIGDACIADAMPKTGHSASSQGKICAAAIALELNGQKLPEVTYSSSIYSLIGPKWAISSVGVYRVKNDKLVEVSGGKSPLDSTSKTHLKEARFAQGWYKGITTEMFGKG